MKTKKGKRIAGFSNRIHLDRIQYKSVGLPMQIDFKAIVQSEYNAPEKVLRIVKRQLKREELGLDDAR
jgi:hypothetical protein